MSEVLFDETGQYDVLIKRARSGLVVCYKEQYEFRDEDGAEMNERGVTEVFTDWKSFAEFVSRQFFGTFGASEEIERAMKSFKPHDE